MMAMATSRAASLALQASIRSPAVAFNGSERRASSSRHSSLTPSSNASNSCCRTTSSYGASSSCRVLGLNNGGRRAHAAATASLSCRAPERLAGSLRSTNVQWGAHSSTFLNLNSAPKRLLVQKIATGKKKVAVRIAAEGTDITKIAGTVLKVGKDFLDASTKFFPESVPRPLAQAAVGVAATAVLSWFLRSVFSTLAFVLAVGALSLAAFVFLTKSVSESVNETFDNKDSNEEQKDGENILDSARKIMDKYK